ncbi:N(4)-(beta-N-acetylglucosaminyl)-L-asparaginase [Terriglobus sp. TAA 43]|uniref:N(4)-(beta-N-acetylglucosaminyl)-L-asparaginase n=1 Tax=Terriglobus sp. TAA 43 TaxID=278961 RepID=UPI000AAAC660|nr:N(4)-(beta-N-acetylglucosaminyl)-L-asparaginase [Terriglobus sp. TAA 43]
MGLSSTLFSLMPTRRSVLRSGALSVFAGPMLAGATANAEPTFSAPKKPVLITRETGDHSVEEAYQMLLQGEDTLTAALHVCSAREDDPADHSVGYGGLPNEAGVVELDASVMHGPTRRCGAVGGVPEIRHVGQLARTVMERTAHVMLAGQGAHDFAVAEGFVAENLLTEPARKIWLLWKEHGRGFWGPGLDSPEFKLPPDAQRATPPGAITQLPRHPGPEHMPLVKQQIERGLALAKEAGIPESLQRAAVRELLWPTTGTINVSALNPKGEISSATTTSGMAFKIPGRLGDSPIVGAGCFVDPEVGSAGATGNGEENIKVVGAHTIVELMRQGRSPKEAGMEALRRIAKNYNNDMSRLRYLDMIYYILRKDGAYAGVSLWSTRGIESRKKFVVHDGTQRTEPCEYLFEGTTLSIHPF